MPMISTAPRFAAMNANPVTQAGSDRPDRKKSMLLEIDAPGEKPDAEHEGEVDADQQVVDPVGVHAQDDDAKTSIE